MIKNFFKKKKYYCAFCGSEEIVLGKTKTVCDFDPNVLEKNIRKKILGRQNGICQNCGISQNFELLSKKELSLFNSINKDNLTSEINFQKYPPSNQYLTEFENTHFKKRLEKWDAFFSKEKKSVKRVLILRFWFGNTVNFLKKRFDCQIDGIDMSDTCRKYVLNHVPGMNVINGEINGILESDKFKKGTYDLIFCFHILTHSLSINDYLQKIKWLLKPSGSVIFSSEVEKKYNNPFHNFFFSEIQLTTALSKFFKKIIRLDNCSDDYSPHINKYTIKNDNPDFVARD